MQILNKTVLIAPLNWGLGHATRSIVIIKALLDLKYNVIIASDGIALQFLKAEVPDLLFLELPSYNISYAKKTFFFKLKLMAQFFSVYKSVQAEKKMIEKWIALYKIDILISDNRFGVYSAQIPSIYITHQLRVFSGITTGITSLFHQQIIKKFTSCWVPDFDNFEHSLAGKLSQSNKLTVSKIGPLSRLKKENIDEVIDVLFLVSGPEPQRTILENLFRNEIAKNSHLRLVLVGGLLEEQQRIEVTDLVTYYNYATSSQIETLMNSSKQIVCRSGYSTIMDLCALQKKALLIPTPGQDEQLYLASYLQEKQFLPFVAQNKFTFENLDLIKNYKGLPYQNTLDTALINQILADF